MGGLLRYFIVFDECQIDNFNFGIELDPSASNSDN